MPLRGYEQAPHVQVQMQTSLAGNSVNPSLLKVQGYIFPPKKIHLLSYGSIVDHPSHRSQNTSNIIVHLSAHISKRLVNNPITDSHEGRRILFSALESHVLYS